MKGIKRHITELKQAVNALLNSLYPVNRTNTTLVYIPVRRRERRRP